MIPLLHSCSARSAGTGSAAVLVIGLLLMPEQASQPRRQAPGGAKLQVLSVRVLSIAESVTRTRDELWTSPSIAVRLRLSTSDVSGVYFFSWPPALVPLGYTVKHTETGVLWFFRKSRDGEWATSSPGVEPLTSGFKGTWSLMGPGMAIEWEVTDNTAYAGERHAITIFLKNLATEAPVEVISEAYLVPTVPRISKSNAARY
jgi:hypothetical protein